MAKLMTKLSGYKDLILYLTLILALFMVAITVIYSWNIMWVILAPVIAVGTIVLTLMGESMYAQAIRNVEIQNIAEKIGREEAANGNRFTNQEPMVDSVSRNGLDANSWSVKEAKVFSAAYDKHYSQQEEAAEIINSTRREPSQVISRRN